MFWNYWILMVAYLFYFQYAILLSVVVNIFLKYALHSYDLQSENPWENKAVFLLYSELVMGMLIILFKCSLFCFNDIVKIFWRVNCKTELKTNVYFIHTNGIIRYYSYSICSTCLPSMSTHNDSRSSWFWRTHDNVSPVICWQANVIL